MSTTDVSPQQEVRLACPFRGTWESTAKSIGMIRKCVVKMLCDRGLVELCDTAALLVSEAATNVFDHTECPNIRVEVCWCDDRVRFEFFDNSPDGPELKLASEDSEDGRGTGMIRLLSSNWGVKPTAQGKIVWFELAK